jgi:hypothetical protein
LQDELEEGLFNTRTIILLFNVFGERQRLRAYFAGNIHMPEYLICCQKIFLLESAFPFKFRVEMPGKMDVSLRFGRRMNEHGAFQKMKIFDMC